MHVVILEAARTLVTNHQIEDIVDSTAKSVCFFKPVVDTVILRDKTYLNRQDCLHLLLSCCSLNMILFS